VNALSLAWRNVWRNSRRSGVTIAAMAFALLTMLAYGTLSEGMLEKSEASLLDLEVGDVQAFALEYRDKPSLYERVENDAAVVGALEDAGMLVASRLLGSGLIAFEQNSAGANLRGIDVLRDARVSKIGERVVRGSWLQPEDIEGVVVGYRLAKILNADVGDEVVLLSQAADGSTANALFTVRGVLGSSTEAVDRGGVFLTQAAFREFFVVDEGAHQLIVRRSDGESLAVTAERVVKLAPGLDVVTWRDLMPTVAQMLDNAKVSSAVMMLIVYTAIGIVLLNAMLMAVFERIREFGVLKALGVEPGGVLRLIFAETLLMTLCALALGLLLSIPALWYLSSVGLDIGSNVDFAGLAIDSQWVAVVHPGAFVNPIVTLVVVVFAATLYPAIRAARLEPLEALRHR